MNKTLDVIKSLRPLIEKSAEANEKAGALIPEVAAAFREHNLFSMYVPKDYGGLGLGPVEALEVIEAVSYADGSSGWVLMAAGFGTGASMAWLPQDTANALWAPGKRQAVLAGTGAPPPGKAVITDGGFTVSGRWSYGSGVKHADYVLAGVVVHERDGAPRMLAPGLPDRRLVVVPRDKIIFENNWDVIGLRATGSIDYSMENVFVPEGFSYSAMARVADRGPLFRLGYISLVPIGHAGWALGVARRVLDELALFAQSKKIPGGIGLSESFQEDFGHHEAALRSARAFLMEAWGDIAKTVYAGQDASTRQETLTRLSLNHITSVATDIATFAYRAGGGTALRAGILQRFCRDMLAGAQHMTSATLPLRETGKELAGLEPGKIWAGWMLIDPPGKK